MRLPVVRLVALVGSSVAVQLGSSPGAHAQTLSREVRSEIISAVVEVRSWDVDAGALAPYSGSGTIISPDGYILTNFHVIGEAESRTFHQEHAIYMTRPGFVDQPPQHLYWATHIASDPRHDLTLLKIHQNRDESPVDPSLTFPAVTVGDSNDLLPGDAISIVGYPGISGRTITFTAGLMGGWVGEDMESGHKQWIKTDAKILHGSSGGAAVNSRGELIGVPTAGRTVEYDELDVEEQAYVRPIGLAWSLIGPNVANVQTAAGAGLASGGAADRSQAGPPATTGLASGSYGEIAVGSSRSATIASGAGGTTFNTYTTTVLPNMDQLTITVDGGGEDVDLAVKAGSEIESYAAVEDGGDYDFLDTSPGTAPTYIYTNPTPGIVYIDVLNLLEVPIGYTVSVGSSGAPVAATEVDASASGIVGLLATGQTVSGRLTGIAASAAYHTYFVDVPAGAGPLTIVMQGDLDFDLAVKHGSTILSYAAAAEGGDWDYRDTDASPDAEIVVPSPAEGRWYIDIFDAWTTAEVGSYTLTIR